MGSVGKHREVWEVCLGWEEVRSVGRGEVCGKMLGEV